MKNKIKSFIRENKYLEILAYILQNNQLLNSSGDGTFSKDIDSIYNYAIGVANKFTLQYNGDLSNKIILEIGTGYTKATMLYMIKECNLKKVYCYDRFNCLDNQDDELIKNFGLDMYLDKLEYISGTNDELLKIIDLSSVDYIVSNAVLEHVDNLPLLFNILTKLLNDNGMMYHGVDLKCHNRFKKYGELYFHTFTDKLWKMMGDKIGQPNRKLLNDYLYIFENENLECMMELKYFNKDEMERAKTYLKINGNSIEKYNVSDAQFKLCKK